MASLSKALKSITDLKSLQLENNDNRYAKYRQDVLDSIEGTDPTKKLQLLLVAIANPDAPRWDPSSSLMDSAKLERYTKLNVFSGNTSLISDAEKLEWCDDIITSLNTEVEKYKYAKLFSKLINESDDTTASDSDSNPAEEGATKPVPASLKEQREEFDRIVFSQSDTNEGSITEYLDELFESAPKRDIEYLRESMTTFCNSFLPDIDGSVTSISPRDISSTIRNLISSGLMDNENIKTLRQFLESDNICREIADVLNAKLASISTWKWPEEGLTAVMRRELNGKYRVYVHADLLDSIFTQYIGTLWSWKLRGFLCEFAQSRAWRKGISQRIDKNFINYYYGGIGNTTERGIDSIRTQEQYSKYFLVQMARDMDSSQNYDSDGDSDGDYEEDANQNFNAKVTKVSQLKQDLLHLLVTEVELSKALGRGHTIIRSDYSWFGPSLSHTTILTVMKYLGVTEDWLKYFKTFLQLPMKFEMDGPNAEVRVRSKGTPMSYTLGDVFGETILFFLDYAVNKATNGLFLYRAHDDFWLWHHDQELCITAWKAIERFNKVMGLKINNEKTGSITIGETARSGLPNGNITWGFLVLDPSGKWVIHQERVNEHIVEMKRQLAKPTAIFTWINCYNAYIARFLPNNFGEPAPCFGFSHIDDIIQTLDRVHQELFKDYNGSALEFLSEWIKKRYGITDIARGWYYLPVTWGGLGLKNPSFKFTAMKTQKIIEDEVRRKNGIKPSLPFFGECLEKDRTEYDRILEDWKNGKYVPEKRYNPRDLFSNAPDAFPSFERFQQERERWIEWWAKCYTKLVTRVGHEMVDLPLPMKFAEEFSREAGKAVASKDYDLLKHIYAVYGEEMVRLWGGVKPVWDQCLPLGMIELWMKKKPEWML